MDFERAARDVATIKFHINGMNTSLSWNEADCSLVCGNQEKEIFFDSDRKNIKTV